MSNEERPPCVHIRSQDSYRGKQGLDYLTGITAETAGAKGVCLHVLTMPPGARANVHYHAAHESAIYMLKGRAETLWGDKLENHHEVFPGDFFYIPAGVPHTVWNPSDNDEAVAVIARTDPNEQESVVLCPELERFVQPDRSPNALGA
jgi:uncharacterized RmlC-like cupin family protein